MILLQNATLALLEMTFSGIQPNSDNIFLHKAVGDCCQIDKIIFQPKLLANSQRFTIVLWTLVRPPFLSSYTLEESCNPGSCHFCTWLARKDPNCQLYALRRHAPKCTNMARVAGMEPQKLIVVGKKRNLFLDWISEWSNVVAGQQQKFRNSNYHSDEHFWVRWEPRWRNSGS